MSENKLIVADIGWAQDVPEWLKTEVELERLAECANGVVQTVTKAPKTETVGDAEACLYLFTASLRAPISYEAGQEYIWLAATIMKRKGIEPPMDCMKEKLKAGLTPDEKRELETLKRQLYRARGGAIKHPVFDALKQMAKKDLR
jgi:hypothetical protein